VFLPEDRNDGRPAAATTIAAIDIAVHTPPLDPGPARSRRDGGGATPPCAPAPTRRQRIVEIMNSNPHHVWSGAELAQMLQVPPRNLLTQLAEWVRLGFLIRTGAGTYAPAATSPAAGVEAHQPMASITRNDTALPGRFGLTSPRTA
jgi:hypothetical protein